MPGHIAMAQKMSPEQRRKVYSSPFSPYILAFECVPPSTFDKFGQDSFRFVAPVLIKVVNYIRVKTGKEVTINNWFSGGPFQNSGFRLPDCPEGASLSAHKGRMAFDIKVKGMTAQEVYKFIFDHEKELVALGLTGVEIITATPTWVHITCEFFWDSVGKIKVIKI